MNRRNFLKATVLGSVGLSTFGQRSAHAAEGDDDPPAHEVEPTPALSLQVWSFDHTAMYGGPTRAVVAVPKGLAADEKVPLIILLPGGNHNKQGPLTGTWGWWSDYGLAQLDTALRHGKVESRDAMFLDRPGELAPINENLQVTPYQGAVYITPWVVGRQVQPGPHGSMVAEFLHQLVARARKELPVVPHRVATGLGGMSNGGLWTIYSGSACSDLFGTLIGTQPYTEDLVEVLRHAIRSRAEPQRLRLITSVQDHQRDSTFALSQALKSDRIEHEYVEYFGGHSSAFAAGIGGLDSLFRFDRYLRNQPLDGIRRLHGRDGMAQASVEFAPEQPRLETALSVSRPTVEISSRSKWLGVAGVSALVAAAAIGGQRT